MRRSFRLVSATPLRSRRHSNWSRIGAVNAISVVSLRILPLLATLAVMNIAAGLELVVTQNTVIPRTRAFCPFCRAMASARADPCLRAHGGRGRPHRCGPIYARGLRLYAVGEFPEAARAADCAVNRVVAGSYVASGVCGGIAAILSVAYLSGSTTGSGDMLLSVVVTLSSASCSLAGSCRQLGHASQHALCGFADSTVSASRSLELLGQWNPGALILVVVAATSILRPRGKLS